MREVWERVVSEVQCACEVFWEMGGVEVLGSDHWMYPPSFSNDEMFRAKLSHSLDAGVEATMRTDTMSNVPRYSCGKGWSGSWASKDTFFGTPSASGSGNWFLLMSKPTN